MNPPSVWCDYVRTIADAFRQCATVGPGAPVPLERGVPPVGGPVVVLASPHPDDEALVGALALRARLELGARVVNIGVTLGSDPGRRSARLAELHAACSVLDFEVALPKGESGLGLDDVNPNSAMSDKAAWSRKVGSMRDLFDDLSPDVLLCPHLADGHQTHAGTHLLAMEAARQHVDRAGRSLLLVETEFWHPMTDPNLMCGLSEEHEAVLVAAVAQHRGEVARNPYHLQLPARM